MEARNIRFATDSDVPQHWHGGKISITSFFNNLSLFFPAGERFFVAAVNHHRDRIQNDVLRAQVVAFCAQEGFHSREHVRYNRMLDAQGYPASELESRIERILRWLSKGASWRLRLAATCALEHMTATLAHVLLGDPEILEGAHPVMAALWRWHAAEENEHKAVAFDVYKEVGGTYLERVRAMIYATVIFWSLVFDHQVRLMRVDGVLWSPRQWWALWKWNFVRPGALRKMIPIYFQYFRVGFHPWDLDNRDLLEKWKEQHAA
jgi:predicted metal-dependent hydrolase